MLTQYPRAQKWKGFPSILVGYMRVSSDSDRFERLANRLIESGQLTDFS